MNIFFSQLLLGPKSPFVSIIQFSGISSSHICCHCSLLPKHRYGMKSFSFFVNICMCFMMTFRVAEATTLSYCAYNQAKYSHLTLLIISMFVSSIFFYRPIFLIPSICIIFLFSCPKYKTMTYLLSCTYLVLYL